MRKYVYAAIVLVILLLAAWSWGWRCGGAARQEIRDAVAEGTAQVENKMDARCDALERKLDRIEGKLDRLLELATPKPVDGLKIK